MTCYAYVMTWVGLLLMQLLGWVSIHDTHHHMGFFLKNCSWYFWCVDFWVVTMVAFKVNKEANNGAKRIWVSKEIISNMKSTNKVSIPKGK